MSSIPHSHTYILLLGLLSLSLSAYGQQQAISEPNFGIVQSHYFEFPLTKKEFKHWKTLGSAVIHKSKVVIVPETRDKKGIFYSTEANPHENAWVADMEVHIGNDMQTHRGGTGLGIFYVRNIDKVSHKESIFGYTNRFEGLGIYLNTILRTEHNQELVNPIQGFYSDGTQSVNVFSNKEHICFRKYRNLPEEQFFRIRIQYDKPLVTVFFYDIYTNKYEQCLTFEANLNFPGYFVLSGSSGVQMPDHVYLKSFKLYDPKIVANNDHFRESRKAKAEFEQLQNKVKESVKDLIHNKSEQDVKQDHRNNTELFSKIPLEHMNLMHTLHRVIEEKDAALEQYFDIMKGLPDKIYFREQNLRILKIKGTLSNLSSEIESYNQELSQFEKDVRKLKGGKIAENSVSYQKKEVNNKQVSAFSNSVESLTSKVTDLRTLIDKVTLTTKDIGQKAKVESGQKYLSELKERPQSGASSLVDLTEIDQIFDDLELQTGGGNSSSIMATLVNLGMVAVIVFSTFIWLQLNGHHNKYK